MRTIAVTTLLVHVGCSFVAVSGSPEKPRQPELSVCTRNPAAPVLDSLLATAGFTAAGLIQRDDHSTEPPLDAIKGLGVAASAVTGIVFGISAAYGFVTVAECRRDQAKDAVRERDVGPGRTHAWEHTSLAVLAAREDDCVSVADLGGEVKAEDPDVFAAIFLSDPQIARCLAPAVHCFEIASDHTQACYPTRAACQRASRFTGLAQRCASRR
jgi:hypothetical protein